MSRIRVIVLALSLFGCTSGAGALSPGLSTAPSVYDAPPASPCIDREQLSDSAKSVTITLQGVISSLKAGDLEQARSLSDTASSGLRKIADLVAALAPDAAKTLRDAATKLDDAATEFPDGLAQVEEIETELEQGYQVAREAACAG